jgi:transcriptional regulator with XRE-family HTH domain
MTVVDWSGTCRIWRHEVGRFGIGGATIAEVEPKRARTLAEKLDRLFHTMHPRQRGEYAYKEVADGIAARGSPTISATYLWELRTGRKDNPTLKHVEALAQFFGVPPAYFLDEDSAERIDEELALLGALRDASVRHMALRAAGLSRASLGTITEMIERVRELEGLPDAPHDGRQPSTGAPDT